MLFTEAMAKEEKSFNDLMSVLDSAIANPDAINFQKVNDALADFGLARHKTLEEFDREFMSDSPIIL